MRHENLSWVTSYIEPCTAAIQWVEYGRGLHLRDSTIVTEPEIDAIVEQPALASDDALAEVGAG